MKAETGYEGDGRKLHMGERIGYGVGDFANNMMYTPVNSFFTYFMTNIAGLGAGVVGTMLLLSRLLDGVSDLFVGVMMEKVHSRHGKARPWLLWWCIPFAVSLVLMFTSPDFGTTGKIIYAFLTYNLAVTVVYTAINLPFGSLAALMTKDQKERGYLNISKMVFAFGGGLVVNMATLPLVRFFGNDAGAWQKTFIIYGIAAIILFLAVFFSTKEAVTEEAESKEKKEKINIKKAIISLLENKYWMQLLGIFFLNSMVNAFIGINVYYAQFIMNDDSLVGSLSLFQTISSFAAFGICTVLNAALSGVMYGMLADTVEYNDWKSGIRAEGLVFSANSIGNKIGSGIGSALLGWILAAFGFVSKAAVQPETAVNGIRVIFLYVPLVVFAAMFMILLFYKLDKEYGGIVTELETRK